MIKQAAAGANCDVKMPPVGTAPALVTDAKDVTLATKPTAAEKDALLASLK